MTAQMTDKEIIEGLDDLLMGALDWNAFGEETDEEAIARNDGHIKLLKAAISRLQSIQWRPIEEIPEEWKDGRGLIGFCEMNECQLECWYDGSPEMKGWVSTHAWGDEIDISFVKPIYDPPTAFNQEEE